MMQDINDPEPTSTNFVSQTKKHLSQRYQKCLDDLTPYAIGRWVAAGLLTIAFLARIFIMQGWYIVAYALGIYHLNLFIAFLTPKIDPALAMYEESESGPELPTRANEEFRPFIRRLPEFKFWHAVTKSTLIAFTCTFFELFNVPVFWPILVMYFFTLVAITMKRQIKHMIKYRYLPFTHGKPKYAGSNDGKGDAVIPLIPPIVAPVIPPLVVPTIPGDKVVK
uniref:Protein RER1 n=2 Tax=Lygus hesperus TaxID=30085 RepID=A0A0K8S5C2_LYGHE